MQSSPLHLLGPPLRRALSCTSCQKEINLCAKEMTWVVGGTWIHHDHLPTPSVSESIGH